MKDRRWLFGALAGVCLLTPWPAWAGDPSAEPEALEQPSAELLHFLSQWETSDGAWIDPTLLDQVDIPSGDDANQTGKEEPAPAPDQEQVNDDNAQTP